MYDPNICYVWFPSLTRPPKDLRSQRWYTSQPPVGSGRSTTLLKVDEETYRRKSAQDVELKSRDRLPSREVRRKIFRACFGIIYTGSKRTELCLSTKHLKYLRSRYLTKFILPPRVLKSHLLFPRTKQPPTT